MLFLRNNKTKGDFNMSTSIKNKLVDVLVADKQFTNQDNGEIVEYKELTLVVQFDGEEEEIVAKVARSEGKSAYRLLQLADDVN